MKQDNMQFMSRFMKVRCGDDTYKIVDGIPYAQHPVKENITVTHVVGVSEDVMGLYERLCRKPEAIRTDAEKEQIEHMRISLPVDKITPADKIRIQLQEGVDAFAIDNLTVLKLNGEEYRFVYIDSTHFYTWKYYNCYHIAEFGMCVERHGIRVERVEKEENIA